MAFSINKTLTILDKRPFEKGLDLKILNLVEELVHARVFSVNYREIKSVKPGCRTFFIASAENERDK